MPPRGSHAVGCAEGDTGDGGEKAMSEKEYRIRNKEYRSKKFAWRLFLLIFNMEIISKEGKVERKICLEKAYLFVNTQ